jgi:hypothetical protein
MYKKIMMELTPKHFLTTREFEATKATYYKPRAVADNTDAAYYLPIHLTEPGLAVVEAELLRMRTVYATDYQWTDERAPLLTPDEYCALYMYTLNSFFTQMNRQLREPSQYGVDPIVQLMIDFTCIALNKMSYHRKFQLADDRRVLTRYMDLSLSVMQSMYAAFQDRGLFCDNAFLSSSHLASGAAGFRDSNTVLKINTRGCKDCVQIGPVSRFNEGEVILPPGFKLFPCRHVPATLDPAKPRLEMQVDAATLKHSLGAGIQLHRAACLFKRALHKPGAAAAAVECEASAAVADSVAPPVATKAVGPVLPPLEVAPAAACMRHLRRRHSYASPTCASSEKAVPRAPGACAALRLPMMFLHRSPKRRSVGGSETGVPQSRPVCGGNG